MKKSRKQSVLQRLNYDVRQQYKSYFSHILLNSFLIISFVIHFTLCCLIVIELNSSQGISPLLKYDPNAKDYLFKKATWFYIFLVLTIYHIVWFIAYKINVVTTVANDNLIDLSYLKRNSSGSNIPMIQPPPPPDINMKNHKQHFKEYLLSLEECRKQYNLFIYKSFFVFSSIIVISLFIVIATVAFESRINQERFRDYLVSIYLCEIITGSMWIYFMNI